MKTNEKIGLTWVELEKELTKRNFVVKSEYRDDLLNWVQFWYQGPEYLAELVTEIVAREKCSACEMPEYVIHHEYQAGDMKYHLICSGCQKKCDGGKYKHENDDYSFRHPKCGAYVFWRREGKHIEEWYCESCKFELLCGNCGSQHHGDVWTDYKEEGEDFFLCTDCGMAQVEEEHRDNHWREPNYDCNLCQQWAEKWEELVAAREQKN